MTILLRIETWPTGYFLARSDTVGGTDEDVDRIARGTIGPDRFEELRSAMAWAAHCLDTGIAGIPS